MEPSLMSSVSPAPKRPLHARRYALLASAAGFGAVLALAAPDFGHYAPFASFTAPAHAQTAQRPVGFADIVEKVKPSVISVRVKMSAGPESSSLDEDSNPQGQNSPFQFFFRRFGQEVPGLRGQFPRRQFTTGQGSGFFISADGYAVTNNHVVDKAESVEVTTDDGKIHNAKVIGPDARTDLALIKVEGGASFPFVRLADESPRIGDWVLAVGNPFGLGGTVTVGIVLARGRDIGAGPYDDFIQIDAPVNKGNSGGPTFDVDGNVIGVNTAIFSPSGGSVGIAFAIPADTVKSVIAQLRDKGAVTRGWIGVQIQTVTPDIADSLGLKQATGALVSEPQKDSPAAKAGIASGDVITALNDAPVHDPRELARKIGTMSPGTSVKLEVVHNGQNKTVSVTLGTLPNEKQASNEQNQRDQREVPDSDMPNLGLTLAPGNKVSGGGGIGVVVTAVNAGGIAAEHGFRVGDVILDVGGKAVATPADVRKSLADARSEGKHTVLFRVKSNEGTKFIALPLGNA